MIVIEKKIGLQQLVLDYKKEGKTIGFVPTMGALHQGHISLVKQAILQTDIVITSVFVNPIQFNNKEDFNNYPSTIEQDITLLRNNGCQIAFIPSYDEIYPETPTEKFSFGEMESVMEGACRPGHFNGVAVVVKRLFDIVQPDFAYFGQKDFQQLAIIRSLVKTLSLPIKIVSCPTIRESDGLAMSSRNIRLTPLQRNAASKISQSLKKVISGEFGSEIDSIITKGKEYINKDENLEVEYFQIVHRETLQDISKTEDLKNSVICTAVYAGNVRLIDNMIYAEQQNLCN